MASKTDEIFGVTPTKKTGSSTDDIFNAVPVAQPQQPGAPVVSAEQPERTAGDLVTDVVVGGGKAALGLVEAGVGLADIATGGGAGKIADTALEAATGRTLEETGELLAELNSPAQQFAQAQFDEADGVINSFTAAVQHPSTIVEAVGTSIPLIFAGGGIGRGVMNFAGKLAPKYIGSLNKGLIDVLAAAIGEGTISAGSAAESIRQQTEDGRITGKQTALAAGTGLAVAAFAGMGGKLANKLGVTDVDVFAAGGSLGKAIKNKGITRQVLEGAFTEGVLEELPQSVSEQMLQNVALDKDIFEGVDKAGVMGVLTGATLGGAIAPLGSGQAKKENAEREALELKIENLKKNAIVSEQAAKNLVKAEALHDERYGAAIPDLEEFDRAEAGLDEGQLGEVIPEQEEIIDAQYLEEVTEIDRKVRNLRTIKGKTSALKAAKQIKRLQGQREKLKIKSDEAQTAKVDSLVERLANLKGGEEFTPDEQQTFVNNAQQIEATLQERQTAQAEQDSQPINQYGAAGGNIEALQTPAIAVQGQKATETRQEQTERLAGVEGAAIQKVGGQAVVNGELINPAQENYFNFLTGGEIPISADEAQAVAPRSEAQQANDKKLSQARTTVDPAKDDILKAISKIGGIAFGEAQAEWGNTISDNSRQLSGRGVFGRPILHKSGGLGLDAMREQLIGHGFLKEGDSIEDLRSALDSAIRGDSVKADEFDFDTEIAQLDAARLEAIGINAENLTDSDLADSGYNELSEEEQQIVDTEAYPEEVSNLDQTGLEAITDMMDAMAADAVGTIEERDAIVAALEELEHGREIEGTKTRAPERGQEGGQETVSQKADAEPAAAKPTAEPAAKVETAPKTEPSDNKIFTEDAYQKARKEMLESLNKVSAGIDPKLMTAGFTIAGYHLEKGARSFAAYSKAMVDDLGDQIKPYLKALYNGVRDLPGVEDIAADMDSHATVAAVDVNAVEEVVAAIETPVEVETAKEPTEKPAEIKTKATTKTEPAQEVAPVPDKAEAKPSSKADPQGDAVRDLLTKDGKDAFKVDDPLYNKHVFVPVKKKTMLVKPNGTVNQASTFILNRIEKLPQTPYKVPAADFTLETEEDAKPVKKEIQQELLPGARKIGVGLEEKQTTDGSDTELFAAPVDDTQTDLFEEPDKGTKDQDVDFTDPERTRISIDSLLMSYPEDDDFKEFSKQAIRINNLGGLENLAAIYDMTVDNYLAAAFKSKSTDLIEISDTLKTTEDEDVSSSADDLESDSRTDEAGDKGDAAPIFDEPGRSDADIGATGDAFYAENFTDTSRFSRESDTATATQETKALQQRKDELEAKFGTIVKSWQNSPELIVVADESELPQSLIKDIKLQQAEGETRAAYHRGKIYMVGDKLHTDQQAQKALLHEAIGHYGTRQLFGVNFNNAIDALSRQLGGRKGVIAKAEEFGIDLSEYADALGTIDKISTEEVTSILTDELLAHLAQNDIEPKLVQKIIQAIRNALKSLGFTLELSDGDLIDLVAQAKKVVVKGKGSTTYVVGDTAFSRGTNNNIAILAAFDKMKSELATRPATERGPIEVSDDGSTDRAISDRVEKQIQGPGSKASGIFESLAHGVEADELATSALGIATRLVTSKTLTMPQARSAYKTLLNDFVAKNPEGRDIAHNLLKELRKNGFKIPTSGPDTTVLFMESLITSQAAYENFLDKGRDTRFSRTDLTDAQKSAIESGGMGTQGKETAKQRWDGITTNLTNKMLQGVVDQFRPLKDISLKAWQLARMSKSSPGAMAAAFLHGRVFLDNDGAIDVDTSQNGLAEVLKNLGDEIDYFFMWMAGNRSEKLAAEGKENLFDDNQIKELKSLNQGTMKDGRDREEVYQQTFEEFNLFKKSILDVARKSGLINAESTADWDKEFYVPFYRVLEDTGDVRGPSVATGLVKQKAFKKLKGGTQQLNDLLTNTLLNFDHLIGASLKNNAAAEAVAAGVDMGAVIPITAEQAVKKDSAIFVNEGGEPVWYEIQDEQVLAAISAIHYAGLNNAAMKVMRKMKRLFTFGITSSPEFRIANLVRDTIQAVAVSQVSSNGFKNLADGIKGMKKDSDLRKRLLAAGGTMEFGYQFGDDPDAARAMIRRMERQSAINTDGSPSQLFKDGVRKMWDWWQDTGNTAENVNRAAIYKQLREKGKTHFEAAFEAADMLDFRQAGAWPAVKFLVQTVPFLNARVQGLDKLGRSATDPKQRKRFAASVTAYSFAAVALYLAAKDDDDWKDQEDWMKDNYLWFKLPGTDTAMTIPTPFEVGAMGTLAWRAAEQMIDNDATPELFGQRLWATLTQTFAFSVVPQAFQPVLDIYANKNPFTERQIESAGMQRLPVTQRKRAFTTKLASGVSQGLEAVLPGEGKGISPVQVDYLVDGYLGWVGSSAMALTDMILRPATGEPEAPDTSVDRYPIMKRFVRRGEVKNPKQMTVFYDTMDMLNQINAHYRELLRTGDTIGAAELASKNKEKLKLRRIYNKASRMMAKYRRKEKLVTNSNLPGAEKRIQLDAIRVLRNALAKKVVNRYSL